MFQIRFVKWVRQLNYGFPVFAFLLIHQDTLNSQTVTKSPPPPKVTIPKLSDAINIDGRLQERVWHQAAAIQRFSSNEGNTNRSATQLRLWYDDVALYLGWHCNDKDLQATLTNRDDRLWEEDVVEFFVTSGDLRRYFEFQWSPRGTIFDAVVTNRCDELGNSSGYQFDPAFTAANLKSAAKIKSSSDLSKDHSSWEVEAMIPFADLNQTTPKRGEVWRGNFFRIDHGTNQPAERSSWSPTQSPQFHHPNHFGYIEFGE